jgi:hypothetical protein
MGSLAGEPWVRGIDTANEDDVHLIASGVIEGLDLRLRPMSSNRFYVYQLLLCLPKLENLGEDEDSREECSSLEFPPILVQKKRKNLHPNDKNDQSYVSPLDGIFSFFLFWVVLGIEPKQIGQMPKRLS